MSPTLMQSRLDSRNQTTSTANRETVLAVVVSGRPAVSTDAAEEVVPVAKGYTNPNGPTGRASFGTLFQRKLYSLLGR